MKKKSNIIKDLSKLTAEDLDKIHLLPADHTLEAFLKNANRDEYTDLMHLKWLKEQGKLK